jgi:hypothetical protein
VGLLPDLNPVRRSPEQIDRMLALVRAYWVCFPCMRLELVINQFQADYHYNSDEAIEAGLRAALAALEGK